MKLQIDETQVVSSMQSILHTITSQAHKRKTVAIIYANSTEGLVWRATEPYEIRDGKYWGYDIGKNDHIRQFTIDEIMKACPLPDKFIPRWEVKI